MLRTACLVAAVALCAATAPPRIELNLAEFSNQVHNGDLAPTTTTHSGYMSQGDRAKLDGHVNAGAGQGARSDHSRMDFVETCQADNAQPGGSTYDSSNCKLPQAKVYDYLDTEKANNHIPIVAKYCQVDVDQKPTACVQKQNKDMKTLDEVQTAAGTPAHEQRGSYLFTYDAKDAAGNHAQQVVFVLIINDETAPHITAPQETTGTIEIGAHEDPLTKVGFKAMECNDLQALDLALDEKLTVNDAHKGNLKMTVTANNVQTETITNCATVSAPDTDLNSACVDSWAHVATSDVNSELEYKISCTDNAGFYGANGISNTATTTIKAKMVDTTPPVLYPVGVDGEDDTETLECDYTVVGGALPWVTHARGSHYSDHKDLDGATNAPIKTFFSATVCRDDASIKGSVPASYTNDVTCTVKDPSSGNFVPCDPTKPAGQAAYENVLITNDPACTAGDSGRCLQVGKYTVQEKCKDATSNKITQGRKVKVVDDTPPSVSMQYKDWTIMKKAKGSGSAKITQAPSTYAADANHAFRTFKIQNAEFKTKCAANRKTTKGFVTKDCEEFIHDKDGAKGQFYCAVGKKGTSHNNEGMCSIATVEIAGMSLSEHAEASFSDQCDGPGALFAQNGANVDMEWVSMNDKGEIGPCNDKTCKLDANAKNVGVYHLQYTVSDRANNANSITFPIQLIDDEAPVIHMEGCTVKCSDEEKAAGNKCECAVRLQASNTVEYTDYGAQCHDYVDGVLSHAVEVSGQVVNMRVPATYTIQYDCADLSGNAAVSVTREVFVEDTEKPVMTFESGMNQGTDILFVEAGFPYADAGATMSDSLDGVCVTNTNTVPEGTKPAVCNNNAAYGETYTYGDTVNVLNDFYNQPSCKVIKAKDADAKSGRYVITVGYSFNADGEKPSPAASHSNGIRQVVNCYMPLGMTFMLFRPHNTPKCHNVLGHGAVLLKDAITASKISKDDAVKALLTTTTYNQTEIQNIIMDSTKFQTQNDVELVCVQMGGGWEKRSDFNVKSQASTAREVRSDGKAEAGVYKIVYDGKDVAGNYAEKIFRTVIVKDTLPPVITLGPQTSLMAETTSVNGWFIGAVACAVSGVALLATSMKKTSTAVPV